MDDAASNLRLPDSGAGHTANVLQNAGLVVSCTSTKTGKPMGSTRSWWSANIACSFRIMLKLVHLHVCRCISMMIHELRIANCQDSRLCLNQYRPISCGFVWSKFQDDPSFFFHGYALTLLVSQQCCLINPCGSVLSSSYFGSSLNDPEFQLARLLHL